MDKNPYRAAAKKNGYKPIYVWLSPSAVEALDKLKEANRENSISAIVRNALKIAASKIVSPS